MNVFTKFLTQKGHNITLYDLDNNRSKEIAKKYDCLNTEKIVDCIKSKELILFCTPIFDTPNIILQLTPFIEPTTIICEISSVKGRIVPVLGQLKNTTLSLHPMFGPDVPNLMNQTFALIPVKDSENEKKIIKELFPEVKIIDITSESHDKAMAYILSLPYFMNLVFANTLEKGEKDFLNQLAGTTFKAQLIVKDCVIGESTELIESLINTNMYSWDVINQFIDEATYLRRIFKRGSIFDDYLQSLKNCVDVDRLSEVRLIRNQTLNSDLSK